MPFGFRRLLAERPVDVGLGLGHRHHRDSARVGDDEVTRVHDGATAGDVDVEAAADVVEAGGDGRDAARPDRQVVLLDLGEVGARAVDHHADTAGGLDRAGDAAADRGVLVVAEPVDDEDVVRAEELDYVVEKRRVLARDREGHRRAGDAAAGQHGADLAIDEAQVAAMADGCGLDLPPLCEQSFGGRRRHLLIT